MALLDLDERLDGMDAQIVHTMHDEIIVEARAEIAEKVAGILEDCMIKPFLKHWFLLFHSRSSWGFRIGGRTVHDRRPFMA